MKTRSVYLKAPWQTELREVQLPDVLQPDEVLLKVEACGICGSDLFDAEKNAKDWRPFGHEVAGIIEKIGANDSGLQVGQKVVLESSSYCGVCSSCRNGRSDLCRKGKNIFRSDALGFSDYMIAPVESVVPYNDEALTPEVACLAEPAGIAWDLVKTGDIQLGDRVCLIGPGPIGLMAIPLALRSGASSLVCIGRSSNRNRLHVAEKLGAQVRVVDEPLPVVKELHGQFDVVLSTAPVEYLADALPLLAFGGKLVYIGFGVGDGIIHFDANDFHFRRLQLRASFASPGIYLPHVLNALADGLIPGKELISHIFPLEKMDEALQLYRYEKDRTLKIVMM